MTRTSNERSLLLYLHEEATDKNLWTDLGPWIRQRIGKREHVGNLGKVIERAASKGYIRVPTNVSDLQDATPDLIHTQYMAYFEEEGKERAYEVRKDSVTSSLAHWGFWISVAGAVTHLVRLLLDR